MSRRFPPTIRSTEWRKVIENAEVENKDILRIFTTTKRMDLDESLAWIDAHKAEFAPSTVIIDTDDGNSLSQYRERHPQVFISKRHLNRVRHLNTLLNRANEELAQGVKHFKEVEEGRDTMCEAVQEYAKEYANEYANEKQAANVKQIVTQMKDAIEQDQANASTTKIDIDKLITDKRWTKELS